MKQPGRRTRFQQSLPVQAAIVTSNLNRYYLSGFLGTAGTLLVTKDKVFYLADGRYFEAVSQKVPFAKAVLVKSKGWDLSLIHISRRWSLPLRQIVRCRPCRPP